MTQTFKCPNCGGPLDYEGGDDATIRCPYCGASVIVPEELRERAPAVVVQIPARYDSPGASAQSTGSRRVGCILFGVVASVALVALLPMIIGAAVSIFAIRPVANVISGLPTLLPAVTVVIPELGTPAFTSPPAFAVEVLSFGSEGIGPGLFEDARSIGVDGEGNIFVGEYSGGRVQKFDPAGKFVTQWLVDGDTPLRALAAGRDGTVYIVQGGGINRYNGATGEPLGKVEYVGGDSFDDVIVTADGGLLAARYSNRDDIVRFNANGEVTLTIEAAISGQTGDSELNTRVAADGLGNIYALGTFNNAVFKFAPDGRFVNKFGGAGDEPGQFRAPDAIAVDGRGRVYVSDIHGIHVFDGEGRYLLSFDPGPIAFGMAFDDEGFLYVAARTKVVKMAVQSP